MAVFSASKEIKLVDHEEPRPTQPTHIRLRLTVGRNE